MQNQERVYVSLTGEALARFWKRGTLVEKRRIAELSQVAHWMGANQAKVEHWSTSQKGQGAAGKDSQSPSFEKKKIRQRSA
jgi:hypothetical protein